METMPSYTSTAGSSATRGARQGPTVEIVIYLIILILAVVTRFMLLDSQAMHHDEGIHTLFGWNIYQGQGYVHDAVYHGPFIYHAGALSYGLFGDSDFTARLMPALFSIATVMLPVLLRRQLGRWGALLACSLLLISPSFLYFGRFVRNDVFGAFWTLLIFVCLVRYMTGRRAGWLYGVAAATSLYFSTKETAYISVAVFGLFLLGRLFWERYGLRAFWPLLGLFPVVVEELWKLFRQGDFFLPQIELGLFSLSVFSLIPLGLSGLAILAMLIWPWWQTRGGRGSGPTLDLVVVVGTLVLPLLSAIPLNYLANRRGLTIDYHSPNIAPEVVVLAVVAIGVMFALSALIGLVWDRRRWPIVAGIFWGVFLLLHTSFFNSMTGWATGLVQALGFWLSQQGVKRIHIGPQYYFVIMPIYETVSVVFGTIGGLFFAWRGLTHLSSRKSAESDEAHSGAPLGASTGPATGLLAWWAPVGFAVYTLAGEQVPWLNVHPTLPFLLLAAALMGRVVSYRPRHLAVGANRVRQFLRRWQLSDWLMLLLAGGLVFWAGRSLFGNISTGGAWLIITALFLGAAYLAFHAVRPDRRGDLAFVSLGVVGITAAVVQATFLSYVKGYAGWRHIYVPLVLVAIALLVRFLLLGKSALRSGALLLFGFLCAYSVSSAWRLAYINNDTPVEMLVYVQTASDVQMVYDELEALSTLTTGADDMAFLYDTGVAWPMEWYFRNFKNKIFQPKITGPPSENATMAFVYKDEDNTSGPYLERNFVPTRYYAFNWWFPEDNIRSARVFVERVAPEVIEDLETVGLKHVFRALARPSGQAHVWRYILFREPLAPLGAREFAFYLREDMVVLLEWLRGTIPLR